MCASDSGERGGNQEMLISVLGSKLLYVRLEWPLEKIETRPLAMNILRGPYFRSWTNKATELIWGKRCETKGRSNTPALLQTAPATGLLRFRWVIRVQLGLLRVRVPQLQWVIDDTLSYLSIRRYCCWRASTKHATKMVYRCVSQRGFRGTLGCHTQI